MNLFNLLPKSFAQIKFVTLKIHLKVAHDITKYVEQMRAMEREVAELRREREAWKKQENSRKDGMTEIQVRNQTCSILYRISKKMNFTSDGRGHALRGHSREGASIRHGQD